ncbi:MAG: hypothetical protein AAF420_11435 [Pseudomonadota bacterium]
MASGRFRTKVALLLVSACWVAPLAAEAPPSLELLEFLADWQDESGEFIDPFELPETDDASKEKPDVEK